MPISAQHTKFVYPDYISPLPADELIKFASKKQEMYDEGVAKVQQNIDAYNSLRSSILTDVEKEYFDKSMGNLVKSISNSAGLDFSNKANVQAVLNIGKPLERDQYITTAISNGKEVSRRQEQLSKMKPGERSVVNDYFYMKDVNDYMNSGKLGQKIGYGKEYTPYVDLSKDWMEFMKTQKPNQDESFNMQSGMGPAYIEKVTVEGYNTTDLANKFKAFIATDPNKMRQFQMDAGYSLEQVGKEGAYQGYVEDMQAKATTAAENARMFKSEADRLQRAYNTTGSATVKSQLEQARQKATYYEQSRLLAEQKASTTLEDFDLGEYMEIYQDKFATNMGNMYATQKVSRDLITNQYWKEANEDARQMRKINADRKTAIDLANLTQKVGYQVDTSAIKPVFQNFDKIAAGLSIIADQASKDGNSGATSNLNEAVNNLRRAQKATGERQLFYIEQALAKLPKRGINAKYQQAITSLLTGMEGLDYETTNRKLREDLGRIRTGINQNMSGANSSLPVSVAGAFSETVGGIQSFDFLRNSANLGNFYIGVPDTSITTSDDGTGIIKTSTTTKYSGDIDKK
jgi:hypothetical protein